MRRNLFILISSILFCLSNQISAQTEIEGDIEVNTTLTTAESPYVLTGQLYVREDATLTIEENVVLDFNNHRMYVGKSSNGFLSAVGATLKTNSSSEDEIIVRDGGEIDIQNCSLNGIHIEIEEDAGENITLTSNNFSNIEFPVIFNPITQPVIENNSSTVELLGIEGDIEQDLTLPKYDWDYYLTGTLSVEKNATLTIENNISLNLTRYNLRIGGSTPGVLNASNATFKSSRFEEDIALNKNAGANITACNFEKVGVKIYDNANDNISITNNHFEEVEFPVQLSVNKAPQIAGNTGTNEVIGLWGDVESDNTLPKYDWDYKLCNNVEIKDDATLTLTDNTFIDLNDERLKIGESGTSNAKITANNVRFRGDGSSRTQLYFYKNNGSQLTGCNFEKCNIRIYEASPQITDSRFYHCKEAIEVEQESSPVITNNDFYNNETALIHSGSGTLNVSNNYWGHYSGPQHEDSSEAEGEIIEGNLNYMPFLENAATGKVSGSFSPQNFEFGIVSTGKNIDTSFVITNTSDIDLMVTGIKSFTSNISVRSPDRFWLLPDSTSRIPFSFTLLSDRIQKDTLVLLTNDNEEPEYKITMEARGKVDSLQIDFIKVNTDSFPVVKTSFVVTDQAGIPISDIAKEAFAVSEDGSEIEAFDLITKKNTASNVSVTLAIDKSRSMSGQPIRDAKNAAIDLVKHFAENDLGSFISFSDNVIVETPFTTDKQTIINTVKTVGAHGGTSLYQAAMEGIGGLKNQPRSRALILLTDGNDTEGGYTPQEIVTYALEEDVKIFTIGLGDKIDEFVLRYIAQTTGGQYFYAPTSKMLSVIYRIISGNLQSGYTVRYTAPDEGPVNRTIHITSNYLSLSVTDSIVYSTGNQYIEFAKDAQLFSLPSFYGDSKSYFYYRVNDSDNTLSTGQEISFMIDWSPVIPCTGKYLGDGIYQFCAEFSEKIGGYDKKIELPDSVLYMGNYIHFKNKPGYFIIEILEPEQTETADVFASVEEGASFLAGAVGAGPSVAAASLSANLSSGMGLNFEIDADGNQNIFRRFESGIGTEVESPAINSVIGNVQAGAKLGVNVTGTLGQTMQFPKYLDNNEKKAKTLYLLETFSLGPVSLSPECSLLKKGLHTALSELDDGISGAYDDLYYSEMYGINLEGEASIGATFALGKGSDQNKLELAEANTGIVLSGEFVDYYQSNEQSIGFGYAQYAGFNLLNLSVMGIDLGSLYGYTKGTDINIGANYNLSSGFHSLDISSGVNESHQILFAKKYNRREIAFNVPEKVISRALTAGGNIAGSLYSFFDDSAPKYNFKIGKDYFLNSIDSLFNYVTGDLDELDEHILIETSKIDAKCAELGVSVEVSGAAILGGGLQLGATFGCNQEEIQQEKVSTIVNGEILPLVEHNEHENSDLFSITDEIEFLFENVPGLVTSYINSFIDKVDETLTQGGEIAMNTLDDACHLTGDVISTEGTVITNGAGKILSYSPSVISMNPLKSAFSDPEIIYGYTSSQVSKSAEKNDINEESNKELCIVSDCYKIRIYDEEEELVESFEPLKLKIAVNNQMLKEYGLGEDEKSLAQIYYYNFDSLMWYKIPDDSHSSPDTVSTQIEKYGTYAVGILYDSATDDEAPEIDGCYPGMGETFDPDSVFHARITEPPLGSGIDLENSFLKIDGKEVDALWNPVNNTISYRPESPLSKGTHTFEIIAADKNGNNAIETISFNITETTAAEYTVNSEFTVNCFPNPASSFLEIQLKNCNSEKYQLRIYNAKGQVVKYLFEGKVDQENWQITWDLTNSNRIRLPAGNYFLRIKRNDETRINKLIIN